jgi:hypothetical protein
MIDTVDTITPSLLLLPTANVGVFACCLFGFVRSSPQSMWLFKCSFFPLCSPVNGAQAVSWCHHAFVTLNFATVETSFCSILFSPHVMLEFLGCSLLAALAYFVPFIFLPHPSLASALSISVRCALCSQCNCDHYHYRRRSSENHRNP